MLARGRSCYATYIADYRREMDKDRVYETLSRAYFSEEMHERQVIDNLPKLLRGVELFVDIGASLGQYTFFANQHMEGGRIVAIEPDPLRFEELERNCHEWASTSDNLLTAMNCAVSDQDGRIPFYATDTSISGGLFKHEVSESVLSRSGLGRIQWHETMVDCFTLNTLFSDRSPDLVKIDVEGAELRVLKGATRILKEGKTVFLVELHGSWADPLGQDSGDKVLKFMDSFGYQPVNFHGRTLFVNRGLGASAIASFKARLRALARRVR